MGQFYFFGGLFHPFFGMGSNNSWKIIFKSGVSRVGIHVNENILNDFQALSAT